MDLRKALLVGLTAVSGLDCDEHKELVDKSADTKYVPVGPAVQNIQRGIRRGAFSEIRIGGDIISTGDGLTCEF